ncbi:glycoside hydrolase family 15 protein [Paracoccus shanxieyensis]|uniref:Glycoside hydrolase family 15 protein n=1 Tax=Paracoccus shanxieyensis TaxID=2675752 RepID=A0A6L6IYA8_9RHOB|nr:glycoside hydrolase family 15 protein [Paracoccus shanxieyensis]MTH65505.1 glycoside hydrolase family 15 protein [Paracoccus shanxieyensis]MTH88699.1 glycoside hydrolase family 15 protein [Paracoccus shanxieyensis]
MVQEHTASLDLGLIGNSTTAALLNTYGDVCWMCLPRFDGDPVFCGLLEPQSGPETGIWSIRCDEMTHVSRNYRRNTAILETYQTDAQGNRLRITDFMPRFRDRGRTFRGRTLVRIVEPLEGMPRITVRLRPRHDYGEKAARIHRGSNHLRYEMGLEEMRLTTSAPIEFVLHETPFLLDRPHVFLLGPDEPLSDAPHAIAMHFLERTQDYWIDWVRSLTIPPDYQEAVIRAAITLKLCEYEETGGIVAALTTSIPEYEGTTRNWDYRYCWLRDSFFTVKALNGLGVTKTMEDYLAYVLNLATSAPEGYMQPLFGLGHEHVLTEETCLGLGGYRGNLPVRRGNAAYTQVQNDGYGSVILAVSQAFFDQRLPRMGGVDLFQRLEMLGHQAVARWNTPDAGLWEFRSRESIHTHSAMMCWGACDRLARIAAHLNLPDRAAYWGAEAAKIREAVEAYGWNEKLQSYVMAFGGDDLDASLLLMPEIGFTTGQDPRYRSTVAAIETQLRQGHHLFRYKAPDDFGTPETAFTVCTFWLIEALSRLGRHDEAREIFAEVLAQRTPLGLLSEGIHVSSKTLWGNFPQTYSMVGLINAAWKLSRKWEDVV